MKTWVLPSAAENWRFSLTQTPAIWGLRSSRMTDIYFSQLAPGDILLMYVTNPTQGFIGFASMSEKYIDREKCYWPDEVKAGKVIYPLRFRMNVETVLPPEVWETARIPRKILPYTVRGFSPLDDALATKVSSQIDKQWRTPRVLTRPTVVPFGPRGTELEETPPALQPKHDEIKAQLVEIGNFQNYVTEVEYQIPLQGQTMRLDVVWKREVEGVPTFAFEVEMSGNVERAGVRLRHAFDRWNSRPYLVVKQDDSVRARNMYGSQDAFGRILKMTSPDRIRELHDAKSALRKLEKELGLIA